MVGDIVHIYILEAVEQMNAYNVDNERRRRLFARAVSVRNNLKIFHILFSRCFASVYCHLNNFTDCAHIWITGIFTVFKLMQCASVTYAIRSKDIYDIYVYDGQNELDRESTNIADRDFIRVCVW